MRKPFVSYAHEDKPEVDDLVEQLRALGYEMWTDSPLPGGQAWWDRIIRRIAECDVFVVIVSRHLLSSVTCRRELQWAAALDKPVLSIAIEQLPKELPPSLAARQMIEYFEPGPDAAVAIAGSLAALPSAPSPGHWPEPPPAPRAPDEEPVAAAEWNARLESAVTPTHRRKIDELLDGAVSAINRGDRATADALANRVLVVDRGNFEAEELLAAPAGSGEIRRMTMLFADLVDSTSLSMRVDPEIYRTVVGRYRDEVQEAVEHYDGHVMSIKGDGLFAVFGYPHAHEDDVRRAVEAGLDITKTVSRLSERVRKRFGFDIMVRVGVHRGVAYLDTRQDDVYGAAANLAARMCSLAEPGSVAVSDAVKQLIDDKFELTAREPKLVKGMAEPVVHYLVVGERDVSPAPLQPLVGRQSEIAYLEESWDRARHGILDLPGVAFRGEAGIGKSRLAWAAMDMAERSHAVVLTLNGSPLHTRVGMHPIRRLLERRCGIIRESDNSERLRRLEREIKERSLDAAAMVPLLAPVLGIPPESGYRAVPAEGRKLLDQITTAAHDYLVACAQQEPALLVVEDMHWFDEDSIATVTALLDEKRGSFLVVMTGREASSLPDSSRARTFELQPLTDQEADELILALAPDMDPQARGAVRRRCDGVPLFIEQVVEKLEQDPTEHPADAEVPDTLYETLFARLRSSDRSVLVVEAAAAIGRTVDRRLLLIVVDPSVHDDVDQIVDDLVCSRVLEPAGHDLWRFRHELLREVAAELPPPTRRRELHGRVADALVAAAADGNPDWSVVATHYERAGRHAEAAKSYEQASAAARQRGALVEARTYLAQGISQIELAPDGAERDQLEVSLRLSRGFLASAAEGMSSADAAADFERCALLSGGDLQQDQSIATFVALFGYYALRADLGRVEQLLGYLDELRTHLSPEQREWFQPFSDAAYGMLAWYRGDFGTALHELEVASLSRSEEGARETAAVWYMPNEATASIYTHLALARYMIGDLARAEAELARTEQRCRTLDFPQGAFSQAYGRQMEVLIRTEAGQLDRAKEVAIALGADAERHGLNSWTMIAAAQQATIDAMSSLANGVADPTTVQSHIATMTMFVDAWRALEVKSLITAYDAVVARLLIAVGQLTEARQRVDTALDLAKDTGMSFYDAELLRIRADTREDDEERRADLRAAMELARKQGAVIFELRTAAEYFELYHDPKPLAEAIDRFPQDSTWPELSRALTVLDA
ncbi:MAG: adenylate/guanylate cyclase domain-containing protein [Mycobacterium sp.]